MLTNVSQNYLGAWACRHFGSMLGFLKSGGGVDSERHRTPSDTSEHSGPTVHDKKQGRCLMDPSSLEKVLKSATQKSDQNEKQREMKNAVCWGTFWIFSR